MPRLLRLYLTSIAIGFALSLSFTALLMLFDIAGLRHLVTATQGGVIAVIMLIWFHTLLFSGVQFGYAVMRLARKPGGGGGKTRPILSFARGRQASHALAGAGSDASRPRPKPWRET